MKNLAQIVLGRRGGLSSAQIISLLYDRPYNVNQIAKKLDMRYNSTNYHVQLLIKYDIVKKESDEYGSLIYLTPKMKDNKEKFEQMVKKI